MFKIEIMLMFYSVMVICFVCSAAGLNVDSRSSHLALAALAAEAEGSGGALSEEAERELWLKELFQSARFYMIKSRNDHNVQLAKEKVK